MPDSVFWRRLDTPGHDAALLSSTPAGWVLEGTAVFWHEAGPACLRYVVDLHPDWTTRRGRIEGFVADRKVAALVVRQSAGWSLNGALVPGLAHLVHLDLGFTPASNLPQLRWASLAVGATAQLPVAWFDVDAATLVELPQRLERRGENAYWYQAPTVPYEGMLEVSPSGFVLRYPGLWQATPARMPRRS